MLITFSKRVTKECTTRPDPLSAPLVEAALVFNCSKMMACGDTAGAIASLRRCLGASFPLTTGWRHRSRNMQTKPETLHIGTWTLDPTPYTLNPRPLTLHSKASDPKHTACNLQPTTNNLQPTTYNLQPKTLYRQQVPGTPLLAPHPLLLVFVLRVRNGSLRTPTTSRAPLC